MRKRIFEIFLPSLRLLYALDESMERFQDLNKPFIHFLFVSPPVISVYLKSEMRFKTITKLREGSIFAFVLVQVRSLAWTLKTVGRRPPA